MMEAVKINGFDTGDAIQVLVIAKTMAGANKQQLAKANAQLKDIYQANWKAIKAFNVREAADRKSQEDESKEQKRLEKKGGKEKTKDLKVNRLYIFNGKHRGKQASREREKIDNSVERESAAVFTTSPRTQTTTTSIFTKPNVR
jgi:hypothetical protein